eukprot:8435080-Ditylum_brightwellii.AAC.1
MAIAKKTQHSATQVEYSSQHIYTKTKRQHQKPPVMLPAQARIRTKHSTPRTHHKENNATSRKLKHLSEDQHGGRNGRGAVDI